MRAHPAGPRHGDQLHDALLGAPPVDLGRLDPAVWSSGVDRDTGGVLRVAGHDVRALAAEFGTPAFLLDEADFRARCMAFAAAFAGADVYYASKAFLTTAVARWIDTEGLGLDVATGGELALALRAGFPPDRILMHGNNKSTVELAAALDAPSSRPVSATSSWIR